MTDMFAVNRQFFLIQGSVSVSDHASDVSV
ncbi:hypothetical protein FBZ92_102212 [Nitrospirillum viridazoti]|uniref:Uncharacterized protein n=1 Tax=Nitrospirillum amazonense TaxID=28077 RepID=A0A560J483_9PROT|nr:hypothetical protein FBZ92_102212 [Nitrospirillum amazonense]